MKKKIPIPPLSVVKLIKLWPHSRSKGHEIGQQWRIGYYSQQDGLDCIWLVDDGGNYNWTCDHEWLYEHFEIVKHSNETDFWGENRAPIDN